MTVNQNPPHENFLRTPLSYVFLLLPTFPFPLKSFCPLEAGNPGHLSLPLPHVFYKLVWNYLELIADGVVLNVIAAMQASYMLVHFTNSTHIYLSFFKVAMLALSNTDFCFSITATYLCSPTFKHVCSMLLHVKCVPCYCHVWST